MMVEMLVRRVVDGRVRLSVEMVDTIGDTECVNLTKLSARLTAMDVGKRTRVMSISSTTVEAIDAEDDFSRQKNALMSRGFG